LPSPGVDPLRNDRHEKFALQKSAGLSAKEAYTAAGYNGVGGQAYVLLRRPDIAARIKYLRTRTAEKVTDAAAVCRSEIIESVRSRRGRAMDGTPITNRDGEVTAHREDFSAGNRCDEILAKMHGFLIDVQTEENLDDMLKGKDLSALREQLVSEINDLDPNLHKQKKVKHDDLVVSESDELAPKGLQLQ